ncbi:heparinase II/III domain-containing protein [Roseibium sp. M-1]
MYNVILWPREQSRYTSEKFIELWKRGQIEIVKAFGPTDIPENPDWTEDPFESRIWSAYYQSMGWAYGGEAAFKAGEFDEFPAFIKNLILDFATDNSDPASPTHDLTYHDGTNAFRLANISYWYETYLKPGNPYGIEFTAEELETLSNSIEIQRDQLLYQLSLTEKWEANNHRFFHSMAISSYATIFGNVDPQSPLYEPDAQTLLNDGLAIVQEALDQIIFTEDGVTAEQSFTYHRLAIGLVLEAIERVSSQGYELDINVETLIAKMLDFDLLTRRPEDDRYDLYISEVGDSYFGGISGSYVINQITQMEELHSEVAKWILSDGSEGQRPEDLNYFGDAGYIVVRPEYIWENERDLRLLVDASPALVSHGHYDNTNVLLSMFGERILVDSGGPYSYDGLNPFGFDFSGGGSLKQVYFETSEAHNIVSVDGYSSDSDTLVKTVIDEEGYSFVSMEREFGFVPDSPPPPLPGGITRQDYYQQLRDAYDDIMLERDVILLKKSGITFVFDEMMNFGTDVHDYTLNWHFDPAALGLSPDAQTGFSQNGIFGDAAFAGSDGMEINYFKGYVGDYEMQGWVSPGLYELVEAPVIELKLTGIQESAWFASAFSASLSELPQLQMDVLLNAAGGYAAYLSYGGYYNVIATNGLGEIEIREYEGASQLGHDHVLFSSPETDIDRGTNLNDWFIGSARDDNIYVFDGDDLVIAGAGKDRVVGGQGDDTTYGGDGDDLIYDLYGDNFVDDGEGNDRVQTGDGDDIVNNGAGDDLITTGGGDDLVRAGAGKDRYHAGAGYDTFVVTGGKDDFIFEIREDHFLLWDRNAADGDLGRNYLYDVEHIAFAGSDDNIFIDDETVNEYRDSPGNDTFVLGGGNDRIYAGDGFDTVIIRGSRDQFFFEDRGTYVAVMDRFIDDGDLGRNYLYDVESIVFTDDLPFA